MNIEIITYFQKDICGLPVYLDEIVNWTVKFTAKLSCFFSNGWHHYRRWRHYFDLPYWICCYYSFKIKFIIQHANISKCLRSWTTFCYTLRKRDSLVGHYYYRSKKYWPLSLKTHISITKGQNFIKFLLLMQCTAYELFLVTMYKVCLVVYRHLEIFKTYLKNYFATFFNLHFIML